MKTYDESTFEEILEPDYTAGYVYPYRRYIGHHDAVEEQSHFEVMLGTETLNGGKGLRGKIVDVPASPAWDEYEDCLLYHTYTEDELEALRPPAKTTPEMVTWAELATAYNEGVNQV